MLPITSIIHALHPAPLLLAPVPDHSTKRNETSTGPRILIIFSQESMFRLSRLLIIDHRDKQTIKQRRVCDCEVKKKKKKEEMKGWSKRFVVVNYKIFHAFPPPFSPLLLPLPPLLFTLLLLFQKKEKERRIIVVSAPREIMERRVRENLVQCVRACAITTPFPLFLFLPR